HLLFRRAQADDEQIADDAPPVRRTVGNHRAAHGAARRCFGAEEKSPRQIGSVGTKPALQEYGLDIAHGGTDDADVRIAPAARAVRPGVVFVTDIEAAEEGGGAVDDQELAVV